MSRRAKALSLLPSIVLTICGLLAVGAKAPQHRMTVSAASAPSAAVLEVPSAVLELAKTQLESAAEAAPLPPAAPSAAVRPQEASAPTTAPSRPRPTAAKTAPSPVTTAGHPCGGDLPPCRVMMRESKGDPTAWNASGCYLKADGEHPARSGCAGKWQFDWNAWPPGYLGYDRADHAPEALQDQRAREMWAGGAGCSHWGAC